MQEDLFYRISCLSNSSSMWFIYILYIFVQKFILVFICIIQFFKEKEVAVLLKKYTFTTRLYLNGLNIKMYY